MKKTTQLSQISTVIKAGYAFRSSMEDLPAGDVQVISMKHVSQENGIDWKNLPSIKAEKLMNQYYLEKNDVLFLTQGSKNFATCLQSIDEKRVIATQHFISIRLAPSSPVLPEFLIWQLSQSLAQKHFKSRETGITIKTIRIQDVEETPIVIPSIEKQKQIMNVVKTVQQEIKNLEQIIEIKHKFLNALAEKEIQNI